MSITPIFRQNDNRYYDILPFNLMILRYHDDRHFTQVLALSDLTILQF